MATEAELKAKADAEAQAKADAARADADAPPWAKSIADAVGACMTRMDSMESLFRSDAAARADAAKADAEAEEEKAKADKARADAEEENKAAKEAEEEKAAEVAADKARKDADDKTAEEMKEREEAAAKADAARADSVSKLEKTVAEQAAAIARLTGAVHISDEDRSALSEVQARADEVANALGERAPGPMAGETVTAYRTRLASKFKQHSKQWATVDLSKADATVLAIAETAIYADAVAAGMRPAEAAAGTMREIIKTDRVGRKVSEFVGSKGVWMDQFKSPAQLQVRINKEVH